MTHGETTSSKMGGSEVDDVSFAVDTYGKAIAASGGDGGGGVNERLHRDASTVPFSYGLLLGGILSQLVLDAEQRLGEVRECIEWYQREEEKQLARLNELRKLAQLTSSEVDGEA